MTAAPPPAPEIRGRLRAVWDHLSRRRIFEAGESLQPLSNAEPSVTNARGVWHLARGETEQALDLLRPLALLPDEITPDPEADIAWRANFILALLKSGNAAGFHSHLDRLKDSPHPGIMAMRKLADESGNSRGMLSRMFGSAPLPELPSDFPPGWAEDWVAKEAPSVSPAASSPATPAPVAAASLPQSSSTTAPSRPSPAPSAHPAKPFPAINPDDSSTKREIRVFISSTFRDMQEERELLVKKVFPELRRICDERFVSFTEVDLRWGITEEEAAEGKVLPICLEEIHTCRPYFIGILGERYGWIPDTVPQEVLDKEPWIQEHVGHRTSVTELEILHGVLRNPKMDGHAFFYFRDPAYAANRGADFRAENPDSAAKLAALKETIRHSGRPFVDPYKKPEDLAAAVKQQFIELIDHLYPKEEVPDPLDEEAIGHRSYARRKLLAYVDRPSHSQALSAFVAAPSAGKGLVVTGDSGSGKTALLAASASSIIQQQSSFVFEHYFGATPDSASVDGFLRRLLGELKRLADIKEDTPTTSEKMREALPLWLAQTRSGRPIVLVLDALNQIQGDEADRHLNWLPRFFPVHIRVVASSLSGSGLDALRERGWVEHLLPLADTAERGQMIDSYLEIYSRKLGDKLRGQVINTPGTANPLFLRTVLEELRQFGSFEKLPDQVAEYLNATTPQDLFRKVIQRWQHDFHSGRDIVNRSLRHLWAARQGLNENEWLDLLSDESGSMDRQTWRPLLLAMDPHLVQRGGLWAFGHDFLRHAVEAELVFTDDKKKQAHCDLADYFENHPAQQEMTLRKASEWPYQLHAAEAWERLEICLTDIPLFLALGNDKSQWELTGYWLPLIQTQGRDMGACYTDAIERWKSKPGNAGDHFVSSLVGTFLLHNGLYGPAESMLRLAFESSKRAVGVDHPDTLFIENSLAGSLIGNHNYPAAQPLLEHVYKARERILDTDHPSVLESINNMAELFDKKGDVSAAQPLFERALKGSEQVHGPEHPKTLIIVNNLAGLLLHKGDYGGAQPLYERALKGLERVFGKDNPYTLQCVNNLGALLSHKRDYAGAEPLYERALEANKQLLGADHPNTLGSMHNLASLLESTGDYSRAQPLYEQALEARGRVLGNEHPDTLNTMYELAFLLGRKGDDASAQALYEQALEARRRVLGVDHPDTVTTMQNLAGILSKKEDYVGAQSLYERVLETRERLLGAEHADSLSSIDNLAIILGRKGDYTGALPMFERALKTSARVLGVEHHDTILRMHSLAFLLASKGDYAEAQPLYEQALEGLLKISQAHRKQHPYRPSFVQNYADCLEKLGHSPDQIQHTLVEMAQRYRFPDDLAGGQ